MMDLYEELLDLLYALDGVEQDPKYHPEGDALVHSLQVFQVALRESIDPELQAAALFHDIGKAEQLKGHAAIGAENLEGLLSNRIVWLVRHHMHLLYAPKRTRKWLRNTKQLQELEWLRAWDKQGRCPQTQTMSPEEAVEIVVDELELISTFGPTPSLQVGEERMYYENKELY